MPHPALTLVIDSASPEVQNQIIDAINETLNACENASLLTGWTWGGYADVSTQEWLGGDPDRPEDPYR